MNTGRTRVRRWLAFRLTKLNWLDQSGVASMRWAEFYPESLPGSGSRGGATGGDIQWFFFNPSFPLGDARGS